MPRPDEVAQWLDVVAAGNPDVRAVRTGALFPDAAARFVEAGFEVIDTLALLRVALVRSGIRLAPPPGTARLAVRRHREASVLDRAAFGDPWGNDAGDLADIRHATPTHHAAARYVGPPARRRLVAFAISGAAGGQGYLQRLAVDPQHQRAGHGRALVIDALAWMRRRRLEHGVVNTAVSNDAGAAPVRIARFPPPAGAARRHAVRPPGRPLMRRLLVGAVAVGVLAPSWPLAGHGVQAGGPPPR